MLTNKLASNQMNLFTEDVFRVVFYAGLSNDREPTVLVQSRYNTTMNIVWRSVIIIVC